MDQTEKVKKIITDILRQNLPEEAWGWLADKCVVVNQSARQLNIAFVSMPQKTGKGVVQFNKQQKEALFLARPHFSIESWTVDRVCRVWLLLHIDAGKKENYFRVVESLFMAAEMNELVALYSALPVLPYPELWKDRCAEGIRSNIGTVLEAIICLNPYPAEQLSEPAWNQLVMKAFFTDKPIHKIIGLEQRANKELARMLSDYANERWAASRTINPQLWRCVGKFIDEKLFPDIQRSYHSNNALEKEAAALACYDSDYPDARDLLQEDMALKSQIESGQLNWDRLSIKLMEQSAPIA
jgi:hypothetical protein